MCTYVCYNSLKFLVKMHLTILNVCVGGGGGVLYISAI